MPENWNWRVNPGTTKATPGKPGCAYCSKCGEPAADTRWENGVEVFEPHSRFGTEVYCQRSNRPVVLPTVQR